MEYLELETRVKELHPKYTTKRWAISELKTKIEYIDNMGNNLLHIAAQYNTSWFITTIIKAGVDINACNHNGHIPIITALLNNHSEIAQVILNYMLNIQQRKLIHSELVTEQDTLRSISISLHTPAFEVNKIYLPNSNLLHFAAKCPDAKSIIATLIELGVDMFLKDTLHNIPLITSIEAFQYGNALTIFKHMIMKSGYGAVPNNKNPVYGQSTQNHRINDGKLGHVEYIPEPCRNLLCDKCPHVRFCVNQQYKHGNTLAHMAATYNAYLLSSAIVDCNADLFIPSLRGKLPIDNAIYVGNCNIAFLFLNNMLKTNYNKTVLHIIARDLFNDILKYPSNATDNMCDIILKCNVNLSYTKLLELVITSLKSDNAYCAITILKSIASNIQSDLCDRIHNKGILDTLNKSNKLSGMHDSSLARIYKIFYLSCNSYEYDDIFNLLICLNIDITIPNEDGDIVLQLVLRNKLLDRGKTLFYLYDKNSHILTEEDIAIYNNLHTHRNIEGMFQIILDRGVDCKFLLEYNIKDSENNTLLHLLARCPNSSKMLIKLIKHNVDIYVLDNLNQNLLHILLLNFNFIDFACLVQYLDINQIRKLNNYNKNNLNLIDLITNYKLDHRFSTLIEKLDISRYTNSKFTVHKLCQCS